MVLPALVVPTRMLVQILPVSSDDQSPEIGAQGGIDDELDVCVPVPCSRPSPVYMTSSFPPVGVGPPIRRCTSSSLNCATVTGLAPASSNSPNVFCATATGVHVNAATSSPMRPANIIECPIRSARQQPN